MALTYYLLQIPPFLFFLIITSLGAGIGSVAAFLFRKYVRLEIRGSHNEVSGFLFLAIASFYGLLLSFIVFGVWGQLDESKVNVSKEGSSALGLYRDIKFYPDTIESKLLLDTYLAFVYNVIDDEFPKMEHMQLSRKTPEAMNKVFYKMEHLNPKNPFQVQLVAEMFSHLNELDRNRGLRIASMETEISPPMWLPIILGAFITLLSSLLLNIEHHKMNLLLNGLLGAFISMMLFLIITLDHPYTGSRGIKPKAYRQIFTMEKWSNDEQQEKALHYQ